jgi:hypothetical protein
VRIFSVTGTPRGAHRLHDLQGQGLVAHQRRTGPLVAHLLRRAAHVDVDDLRPAVDVVGRGLGHHGRIGAGDLDGDGTGLAGVVGPARGLERVPQVAAGGDHLAHRMAGAELPAQLSERAVGDACHGRDEDLIRQLERADAHGGRGRGCC